jgi:hypothetical protein
MKYLMFLGLALLSACSGPQKVRVKNCVAIDINYYECELIDNTSARRGI